MTIYAVLSTFGVLIPFAVAAVGLAAWGEVVLEKIKRGDHE